jgi:hypothetical protein
MRFINIDGKKTKKQIMVEKTCFEAECASFLASLFYLFVYFEDAIVDYY